MSTPGNSMERGSSFSISGDAVVRTWGIRDVPAFKNERYISTPANHISRIEFQLRAIRYSEDRVELVIKDWGRTSADLMNDADFSKELYAENGWLDNEVKRIAKGNDDYEKIKAIYDHVRDNYTCTDHDAKWLSQTLRKTMQQRKGNVADINMLLTAMFMKAGYVASPVLISTKDNGMVNHTTALLSQFNYLISRVFIGENFYLLDASQKMGFGDLSPNCYNGAGRVIEQFPVLVTMEADSISNESMTSVTLVNAEKGKMEGLVINWMGTYESMDFRDKYLSKSPADVLKDVSSEYTKAVQVLDLQIDSLKNYDYPIVTRLNMRFSIADDDEDVIYFTPFLESGYTKNPFVSAERKYPVEMPYCLNDTYLLTMDIPNGYEVEELPKSTRVNFNENEGSYEFIVAKQGNKVMVRSKLSFKKATFPPEDYETLRDFFGFIVKKHAEMIVFKKK